MCKVYNLIRGKRGVKQKRKQKSSEVVHKSSNSREHRVLGFPKLLDNAVIFSTSIQLTSQEHLHFSQWS